MHNDTSPLLGVTVLDVSRILSGPFCTMLLSDLGAEVIKIEQPGRGDIARNIGSQDGEDSASFISVNRGKKSVSLNIFHDEGKKLFRRLARGVDVLVENYVPGTMSRLGLDHRSLKGDNPRLIYASISGFGQTGPYAQRPALDIIVQAMGGMMGVTGEVGGAPIRPGASLGDSIAGLFAALSIISALYRRQSTGEGEFIDISMLDSQVTMMENAVARYFASGVSPTPLGSRHPAATPFQAFPTADGYIVVALLTDDLVIWNKLCNAIGTPHLIDDDRFRTNNLRTQHHAELEPILAEAFRSKPSKVWLQQLEPLGIPCSPVNTVEQVVNDPQVVHRQMVQAIPHRDKGAWLVANTPFRFAGARTGPQGAAPALGEHTDKVLKRYLDLTDADLARLRADGVI